MKVKNKLFVVLFLMVVAVVAMMAVMAIEDVSGEADQMRGDGWMEKSNASKLLKK